MRSTSPPAPASTEATSASHHGARRLVATGAILLGLVVAAFEGTVVTSAMPTIAHDLAGMDLYAWVFAAFLVASTVGVLVCGKLADAYGRRPVFVGGMALFLAGSLLCGASRSIGALVAFRVVQGLGAGAIQPIVMTISADIYSLEERARVQAAFTSAWGGANVLGPLIGGWIVAHGSWRWVFLVNVPFGLLAVALLCASYRDPPRARTTTHGLGGALLAGSTAGAVLLAIEGVGHGRAVRAVAAAVALAFGALFVRDQRRSESPLLTAAVLRHRVVRAGIAGGLGGGAMLYACAAYVPLWMSARAPHDTVAAGAALIPLLGGWAFGSSFGVRVLVRRGMRASVVGGFAIGLLGAVLLALAVVHHAPTIAAFAALGLMGLGFGPANSTSLVAPQTTVDWRARGAITSTIYATRTLGGSLAVAMLGAMHGDTPRFAGIAAIAACAMVATAVLAPAGRLTARAS